MIDPAQWKRLSAALDEALNLAPEALPAWLDALERQDPGLAAELRPLLAEGGSAGADPLPTDFGRQLLPVVDEAPAQALLGLRMGPWRLDEKIGEGGMGQVWRAHRDDGLYEGQTAIKLLRSDRATAGLISRFARERSLLARLNHPAIARLLDAGLAHGQAYLVLELVHGQPMSAWVRAQGLDLDARVALLMQVAEAVDAAHAQLIVHRDLKPGNVMVTAEGQAKLLDFGVAALLDEPAEQAGELTRQTGRGLTVGYAAPEQILGEAVGTTADVFSLGVMLFELASGGLPFGDRSMPRAMLEMAVLDDQRHRLADAAVDPGGPGRPADARRAAGDLEAVIDKALRQDPIGRYASVRALIDDLQRWRRHQPVEARRGHWRHRSALWLRRNALLAGATVAVVAALAAGLGAAVWQWQRAEAAAREAAERAVQGQRLSAFMLGELAEQLRPVGRLDMLARIGEQAASVLARRSPGTETPADTFLRAKALVVIGEVDSSRGRGRTANALAALAEARSLLAPLQGAAGIDPQEWFATAGAAAFWVGQIAFDAGDGDTAWHEMGAYRALCEAWLAAHPDSANARTELAYAQSSLGSIAMQRGEWTAARQAYEAVLAQELATLPAASDEQRGEVANTRFLLAEVLHVGGQERAALAQLDAGLALLTALVERHPGQAGWQRDLATHQERRAQVLGAMGRHGEALAAAEASIGWMRRAAAADPASARWRAELALTASDRLLAWLDAGRPAAPALAELQALLPAGSPAAGPGPDPQTRLAEIRALYAQALLAPEPDEARRRLADAKALLVPLLRLQPRKWTWTEMLARLLQRQMHLQPGSERCAEVADQLAPLAAAGQGGRLAEVALLARRCASGAPVTAETWQQLAAGGYRPSIPVSPSTPGVSR